MLSRCLGVLCLVDAKRQSLCPQGTNDQLARHYLLKGQILHLTPGVRKENHFKESEYARIPDLQRESPNKNFVLVETYPEPKCTLERKKIEELVEI